MASALVISEVLAEHGGSADEEILRYAQDDTAGPG